MSSKYDQTAVEKIDQCGLRCMKPTTTLLLIMFVQLVLSCNRPNVSHSSPFSSGLVWSDSCSNLELQDAFIVIGDNYCSDCLYDLIDHLDMSVHQNKPRHIISMSADNIVSTRMLEDVVLANSGRRVCVGHLNPQRADIRMMFDSLLSSSARRSPFVIVQRRSQGFNLIPYDSIFDSNGHVKSGFSLRMR